MSPDIYLDALLAKNVASKSLYICPGEKSNLYLDVNAFPAFVTPIGPFDA
jgi:hypothetical protein